MPDDAAFDAEAEQLARLMEKLCALVRQASACEQEIAALVARMEQG